MCSFLLTNVAQFDLRKANSFQQLRGPDTTRSITVGGLVFVHNLLSITGAFTVQPFIADGLMCMYNGQIYNFSDFGGFNSDGQCLLPAYRQAGPDFVRELDGEFGLIIVDREHQELLISSDTFGTKPIHIAVEGSKFGVASYASALSSLGFKTITKMKANEYIVLDLRTLMLKKQGTVHEFLTRQYKTHFDDWREAFKDAVNKRTANCREKIFIGLSSGYDSGAIACQLDELGVDYKTYSIMNNERTEIIEDRVLRRPMGSEFEFLFPSTEQKVAAREELRAKVEQVEHEITSAQTGFSRLWQLHADDASSGLALIFQRAQAEGRKVYLSGQGADEILSDYGLRGEPIYKHSNFGGYFPEDLEQIYPWPSFFGSTQAAYLAKEEYVAGSYGIEARYPFLDKHVVQEFLSLEQALKNSDYKSVLCNLFKQLHYPYSADEKLGFVP
jgi:asparagine synthetase B (glutamine-hydrolysing)